MQYFCYLWLTLSEEPIVMGEHCISWTELPGELEICLQWKCFYFILINKIQKSIQSILFNYLWLEPIDCAVEFNWAGEEVIEGSPIISGRYVADPLDLPAEKASTPK